MIVDDHELLAASLRLALISEGYEVDVPPATATAVYAAAQHAAPDVVLLDLDLGEAGGDGSVLVEALCIGGARVVVVSGTADRLVVAGCLEAGACGYVSKSAPLDDLLAAVRAAATGDRVMPESQRRGLLAELKQARADRERALSPFDELTGRERYVLAQVMDGHSASDIAQSSYVSEATVRTQIRAVLNKLGVRSQLAAVAAARRAGWHPAGLLHTGSHDHRSTGSGDSR
jgi:two-component system nitrate/nitrite response regulator NarL